MADGGRPAWVDDELFPFESRFVAINGHTVHYVDEGAGPTLLLLHGNPTWSFVYRDVIRALREEFRCVALDYPGFGLSSPRPGYRYLPEEHAQVVAAHLQTLKQAGFVTTRRDGVRIHYRLAGKDVARLFALLRTVAQAHQPAVSPARDDYLGPDGGAEITRTQLRARVDVVVLDVRPAHEYRAGHIPGAVNIPVGELAGRIGELPEDTEIVVYCRGEYCVLAYDAVRLLTGRGRRAIRLDDGMLEWRLADLPVETVV
ncbi:alpha/beta fold hydrolase [Amycolatopsis sp. NPDC005003]